jgi:hypothetical protein
VLAACAFATTLLGAIPHAHAQGGANAPRTKAGASARPTSERGTSAAESGGTAGDKARREASGGDTGSQAYRDFIEQGLAEFKLQNWPEARLLFRRAHELNPNARTSRSIGMVSFEMREYVPAVVALTEALADARQPLTPAQRKECEALLVRAGTFVGAFALHLTPAQLTLTVDGAAPVFDADGRLLVAFGEHTLQASAPEHEIATRVLTVEGGEVKPLEIVLRRFAQQPSAALAEADQRVAPRNDAVVGPAAVAPVAREHEGGLRYTWVALGASSAFGAAAVGTWMLGQSKFQNLKDQCEAAAAQGAGCVRGETDVSVPQRLSRTTNVLLGLSAASLVTTVVLLPIEWPRERRLTVGVGPSQLSVRGSF